MPKKNNPGCGCCETGCEVTCSDTPGDTAFLSQLTFEFSELTSTVKMLRVTLSGSLYTYHVLEVDLTPFNGSYVILRDENCNFPTDPVYEETVASLSYSYTRYQGVSGSTCPSVVVEETSGTTSVRMQITLSNHWVIFRTGIIKSDFFSSAFKPVSGITPCEAMPLWMDQNYATIITSVACTSETNLNGTATPS